MKWNNIELPEKNIYFKDDDSVIYCADCRDILPHFGDKTVDLVLTDPPYNGDLDYGGETNDSRTWNEYVTWLIPLIQQSERISAGPVIYFLSHHGLIEAIKSYPPYWVGAWLKPCPSGNPVGKVGATLIMPYWEPYLIYGNLKTIRASLPDKVESSVNRHHDIKHPCPKPIKVMQTLIGSGDFNLILDPFLGSGTTAVCAKKLGRKCIGIEISETYCEIAKKRLSQSVMKL